MAVRDHLYDRVDRWIFHYLIEWMTWPVHILGMIVLGILLMTTLTSSVRVEIIGGNYTNALSAICCMILLYRDRRREKEQTDVHAKLNMLLALTREASEQHS